MNENFDNDISKRKLLSSLSHGSIFLSMGVLSIGIPIAIFLVSDDSITKENAKEALNFHLNVWLYGLIFGILTIVLIGWPLLGLLGLVTLIVPILAILKVLGDPNTSYRYPFIFRVL